MSGEDDSPGSHSTIVRRGRAALSFFEMAGFARDLEARPLDRLVTDLPGLLALPDPKYGLVAMVLAKRMRQSPAERAAFEAMLRTLASSGAAPGARKRCEDLLKPA
jgi:hypothetical protein